VPRPSWILVLTSLLVIGMGLAVPCVIVVACATEPPNPFLYVGSAVTIPVGLLTALAQYRGTFRRVGSAATLVGNLLFGLAAFTAFGLVANLGEVVAEGRSLDTMFVIGGIMLLVIFISGGMGALNAAWARQITRDSWADADDGGRRGVSLRELMLGVATCAVMIGMTAHAIRTAPPVAGEHFDVADAPVNVPADASDVCFSRGLHGREAYEFTIDEAGFRQWIAALETTGKPNAAEEISMPVTIARYVAYASQFPGDRDATISKGLFYDVTEGRRHGRTVFDRSTNRAYYESH
jgi:hypothetical protein